MKVLMKLLFAMLFAISAHAQINNFTLQVTKTDETCLGNGSLTFTVTGQLPNSSVLYKVYLLPNTTNPIAILYENQLGNLESGSYKVEAIQYLNDQSASKEQTITINDLIQPFNFTISAQSQYCASGGSLIVNVTSGVGESYEIISGPVTRPLQPSNIFEGLPPGKYNIRAYSNCGTGKVKTYTLSLVTTSLSISDPVYPDVVNTVCDSIRVNNSIIASTGAISYPVQARYTLSALTFGGNPIVYNRTYAQGDPQFLELSQVLPRYMDQTYTYTLEVFDSCNPPLLKEDMVVDADIDLSLRTENAPCTRKFLVLSAYKYTTSYTIQFLQKPDDFNPDDFNPMANGSFTDPVVTFGSSTQPVPFGTYIVKITDVCGRTTTESIVIEFIKPTPSVLPINNGCFSVFGKIRISVPPQEIITAKITAASPVTYTASLPQDVSGNINTAGTLVLNDMPVGFYTIVIKDNCGFEYEIKDIEVPEFKEKAFNIVALPACDAGFGTVRARSGNGALTHVEITSGPGITAAQDVSANIVDGFFFMAGLPAGHYVFTATDICGIVKPLEIDVEGYNPQLVSYSYTPNCGNFSVLVTDDSNGIEGSVYWLQKFNPVTGMWGHPNTGVAYIAGTVPSAQNGAKLSNGVPRNNLAFSGTFRVIKVFETFGSGTAETTVCISVIGSTFTFTEEFSINGAYSLACNGDPNDVILDISGQPSSIRITEKDGQSFVVDNGTNNIFQNLQPASYTFEIENACGDILERTFDILTLPGFAEPTQPNDMIECAPPGTMQTYEFHLTDQNEAVLNGLFSSMYTITYHTSQADADTGDNPLPEYYNATGGETIYVRLVHNEISICYGTTSFRVFIGEMQEPVILTEGTICNDGQLTLTSEAQYTNYFWSTGETTRSITVTEPGIYTLTVQKEYGNVTCPGIKTIEIKESSTPEIIKIGTEDWTDDQNMITVSVQGIGEYEYSINGTDYQESNVFTGLEPGVYIVFVKDKGGCGTDAQEVVLLSYPKFFTPNGDGVNETWRIKYAVKEPGMKVVIFDRYGKIITSFGANSEGWDGTYNGTRLPATDYWFVVTRQDGREFKGHFSMLR